MPLNIPTKQDFLETYEQARDALFLYVRQNVFPSTFEGEDDSCVFEIAFLENRVSLELFWSQYGEIGKYPNEFRQFCWQIIKENKSQSSGDMLDLAQWIIDPISGEVIYYKDKTHEDDTDDGDPKRKKEYINDSQEDFSVMQENGNKTIGRKKPLILFKEQLDQLNAIQQKRVYVFYLSAINFIAVNASNSPSDMPNVAQELLREKTKRQDKKYGSHLKYEQKFTILAKSYPLYIEGLSEWAVEYENKYYPYIRDEKARQKLYKQLYKEAGFHKTNFNSSRFHAKIADLFIECMEKGENFTITDSFIQKVKKKRPPLQLELKPLPIEAYTARDKMLHSLDESLKHVCKEYEPIMLGILRNEVYHIQEFVIPVDKIKQYLFHKSQCSSCKQTEESMREVMEYRYSRLKEIENKPIFSVHEPNKEKTNNKNAKQLVRYYEERYQKIPCELHKYYLASAYKQSGEVEKGRNLLNQISSENLAVSHMGTVISIYCACGKEDMYHLNALRAPKVAIGRLDEEDPLDIPQINVCQPDGLAMSRDMLTLEYQANRQDWLVHSKKEQEGNLWFLSQDKLFNLLDRQIGASGELNIDYAGSFELLTHDIWLSDIAGIGVFWEGTVLFAGKLLQGVKHPLLGQLPVGWYIEVKAQRRSKTIMKSFAEKSFIE